MPYDELDARRAVRKLTLAYRFLDRGDGTLVPLSPEHHAHLIDEDRWPETRCGVRSPPVL